MAVHTIICHASYNEYIMSAVTCTVTEWSRLIVARSSPFITMPALQNEGYLTWLAECFTCCHALLHRNNNRKDRWDRGKHRVGRTFLKIPLERTTMRCCDKGLLRVTKHSNIINYITHSIIGLSHDAIVNSCTHVYIHNRSTSTPVQFTSTHSYYTRG